MAMVSRAERSHSEPLTDAWLLTKWCVEIDTPAVACSLHAPLPAPAGRAARSATGWHAAGLVAHLNTALVRRAWAPGTNAQGAPRSTPPLSHEALVEVARQWLASGSECPGT